MRVVLHGLTQREITGSAAPRLMETVMGGELERVGLPADVPDVDGYIDLAMRSGFPEPVLRLGPVGRQAWLDAYLEHVVFRDVRAAGKVRDPVHLNHVSRYRLDGAP